ncbi:TonB-dependent receptor [Celeribacter sp.]|uniref:TonB-dependent receptor n=1 Tax=Celeribacter sp. TaxID=1890673 RepID=UPI003A922DBC
MSMMNKTDVFMWRLTSAAALCAAGVLSVGAAWAEEVFELDAITVTGTGFAVQVMDNPASLTVQGETQMKRIAPKSVASFLNEVPGVQVSEEGIERVSIRGETAARVAVLINGQKLTDHSNYGQPIMVDPSTIERIEVVRGPSSVITGSSAIGGVINIILKKGTPVPFEMTTTAGYFSATKGWRASNTISGTVAAGAGELDYRLSFGASKQGDRETPNGTLDPSSSEDQSLSAHMGWTKDNHYFAIDAMAFDLGAEVFTEQNGFTIDLPKRNLRKVALSYEATNLSPVVDKVALNAFYQTVDRVFDSDISQGRFPVFVDINAYSEDAQKTTGLNGRVELSFGPTSRTVFGFEYVDDAVVTDKTTTTRITNMVVPSPPASQRVGHDEAGIKTLALYGQHEMDLSSAVTATVGARWFNVSASLDASSTDGVNNPLSSNSDSGILGAAGLVWRSSDALSLRANLSQGYTYPTLSQLFLTTVGGSNTTYGNPDLKPETATTLELGARYDGGAGQLDATLFYTKSDDYIAKVITGRTAVWENVDEARAYGLELQGEYNLGAVTPYASLALMRREITYANGFSTYDSGTPRVSGRLGVKGDWDAWNMAGDWDVFMRGASGAGMRDQDGVMDGPSLGGGYATLNLAVSAQVSDSFRVSAEVGNLFDCAYEGYDQNPGAGRNIAVFATKTW